ncbi:unnamed protein product [Calypogeia fissa]
MASKRLAVQPPPPLLSTIPASLVHEFAKVAVAAILKGEMVTKGFAKAARHLQTTVEAVAQAVAVISNLYSRAARGNLSHQQLVDFLSIQGFGENLRLALADSFVEHVSEMREVISVMILQSPTYQGLDWRLDLQVASRSLRNQSVPTFLLKLSTRPARLSLVKRTTKKIDAQLEQPDELYLEARYVTLKAVCSQLELALAEARSGAHGFRVMRLIK